MERDSTLSSDGIDLRVADGVAHIILNRPGKKNALTQALWALLTERVEAAARRARVIVISGAGRDFCAGADIAEFDSIRTDVAEPESVAESPTAFAAIRDCEVPTIAAIKGICFGGGFGIAAACDIRLASPEAQFSVPAARLGLAYPVEAMRDIVQSCGPQMARLLTFGGKRIDAARAFDIGFLAEIASFERLDQRATELALAIAQNAPLSVAASRASIRAALSGSHHDRNEAERRAQIALRSEDYAEGRAAFRDRRKPVFRGS